MPKYYSTREIILRILWSPVDVIFFRCSPRLLYGWRNLVLKMFGASVGRNVQIFPSARITFPWLLTVEDDVVISWNVKVYNLGAIRIGAGTIVSQYAHLCGGTHDFSTQEFTLLRTGLTIGKNVWIAADAFIGPGVSIGDNVVVGARAVVLKDVEADTIVAGNPAKVIRKINKPARKAR
jgi:putative colanic acid biosynthesis acetyltransferase WcaF